MFRLNAKVKGPEHCDTFNTTALTSNYTSIGAKLGKSWKTVSTNSHSMYLYSHLSQCFLFSLLICVWINKKREVCSKELTEIGIETFKLSQTQRNFNTVDNHDANIRKANISKDFCKYSGIYSHSPKRKSQHCRDWIDSGSSLLLTHPPKFVFCSNFSPHNKNRGS